MAESAEDTVTLSLAEQVEELKSLVHAQKKELLAQHHETKRLRETLRLRKAASEENDMFVAIDDGRGVVEQQPDSMAPVWDTQDNIFRCLQCGWEVAWDHCPCWSIDYSEWDVDAHDADEEKYRVTSSEGDTVHPSRWHVPRGTTPPLQAYAPYLGAPPSLYKNREKEYRILIGRGATPLMCQRFRLEFTPESGIVAWVDKFLFDEFAGDAIKDEDNDRWRIYIGRELELREDDEDGSAFMSDMIEGVWDLSLHTWTAFWETAKDDQGIWTTKLRPEAAHESDLTQPPHNHEGVFQNKYCEDSDESLSTSDMEGLLQHNGENYDPQDTTDEGSDLHNDSSSEDEMMFSGDEDVMGPPDP